MDVHMVLAKLRHQNWKDIARGFGVICVCAVALVGYLSKFYVG
jgi:hypothetical protein